MNTSLLARLIHFHFLILTRKGGGISKANLPGIGTVDGRNFGESFLFIFSFFFGFPLLFSRVYYEFCEFCGFVHRILTLMLMSEF